MKKTKILLSLLICFAASTLTATIHTVNAGTFYYSPSSLTIALGDTVEWINDAGNHDVNADIDSQTGLSFNNPVSFQSSATNTPGAIIHTHAFTTPGAYNYDCSIGNHAANGMVGSIIVTNNIYDIVSNSTDHNTLKTAIDACGLDVTLSDPGSLTLFAPTDAAFNLLPAGTVTSLLADIAQLTDILKHHVVDTTVMSSMLSNNQIVTTLNGDVLVTINTTGVFIDNAQVTGPDIIADNGVVHVINAVLLPPVIDCAGITDGTALVDSCGTCNQAYIYNFQTNTPTFVDNANILVAGVDYNPASETVIFADNVSNPLWVSDPALCNSIYNIVSNSTDHTTLKTAIDACGLDDFLSDPGTLTLFAPTDAAFNLLPAGTVTSLLADIAQLTDILKHHVVDTTVMSSMLSNNQIVTTLNGDVLVTINTTGVFIDNAQVTGPDIIADNGVVHVIDAVLLPTPSNTIWDIVSNSSDHTTLKTAIVACGLDVTLSDPGSLTLFAPTDAAFNLLPAGTVTSLLADIAQLTDILKHHVVDTTVMSSMLSNNQIVTTLNGDVLVTINTTGVFIDNAQVTGPDIIADNGVVHVIDAVLLPTSTAVNNINVAAISNYLFSVNILGKKINRYVKNQVIFDIYSNGEVVKRFVR